MEIAKNILQILFDICVDFHINNLRFCEIYLHGDCWIMEKNETKQKLINVLQLMQEMRKFSFYSIVKSGALLRSEHRVYMDALYVIGHDYFVSSAGENVEIESRSDHPDSIFGINYVIDRLSTATA